MPTFYSDRTFPKKNSNRFSAPALQDIQSLEDSPQGKVMVELQAVDATLPPIDEGSARRGGRY